MPKILEVKDLAWAVSNIASEEVCNAEPHTTEAGTVYFTNPGVALLAAPVVCELSLSSYLTSFNQGDNPQNYYDYIYDILNSGNVDNGAQVCKIAGQICYQSFSKDSTPNREARKYFDNIKAQAHFSVLEHANYSLLFWGISRSCSHEVVRHRHLSFSQVSQRYCDNPRFVERPEYQTNPGLHESFLSSIDEVREHYNYVAQTLLEFGDYSQMSKRDARKAVNQAARSVLPNETETAMVITGNARAWRHFLNIRATVFAEPEIRALAVRVFWVLVHQSPLLFGDYEVTQQDDGTFTLATKYTEV
jgi:thymidylate synthase (FAD)